MARFRKKPVEVDAVQWTGSNTAEIADFLGTSPVFGDGPCPTGGFESCVFIDTLEGTMRGNPGDWIIRGVVGEPYPCKPDIFAATYEPA